jgi:hypothetical protein
MRGIRGRAPPRNRPRPLVAAMRSAAETAPSGDGSPGDGLPPAANTAPPAVDAAVAVDVAVAADVAADANAGKTLRPGYSVSGYSVSGYSAPSASTRVAATGPDEPRTLRTAARYAASRTSWPCSIVTATPSTVAVPSAWCTIRTCGRRDAVCSLTGR